MLDRSVAPSAPTAGVGAAIAIAAGCAHCGQPLPSDVRDAFCCNGCRAVHDALHDQGLERFYALRGPSAEPVGELRRRADGDLTFLEPLEATLAAARAPITLALSVQGVRCAACVWAFEQLFRRLPGALRVDVSVARGRAELHVAPSFPLRRYVGQLAALGYRAGDDAAPHARDDDAGLLLRMGVCIALAMNAMAFGAAIHVGVPRGWLHGLLTDLSFAAAMLTVLRRSSSAPRWPRSARARCTWTSRSRSASRSPRSPRSGPTPGVTPERRTSTRWRPSSR
jgi:Cu2+-exporting ATPase